MGSFYAFGNALVSRDELLTRAAEGNLHRFNSELQEGTRGAKFLFSSGIATTENVARSYEAPNGAVISFEPIGIGKPLTVQIRHLYTGNKARGFWGNKDMLVTSAIKSISTYDAAPRAINFLVEKSENNRNFRSVAATDKGTPIVCYSSALAQMSSVVTLEVMFSGFPRETFDAVSQAFSASSSIPVFAPASGYLVAAGIVTKLLGNIGKSLTDGTPALKRTEEITFVTPGSNLGMAGFVLLISDSVESKILQDYKINKNGALARVDNENELYDGELPYAVILLDGRENSDLKEFSPTAATAAQLDQFYNISDGGSQPLNSLVDALKLYNDMRFRDKALNASENLKKLDKSSVDYQKLLMQFNAYIANIGTKELQPPTIP
jgi:hypothetical protein